MNDQEPGPAHVSELIGTVLKEALRRSELRPRLEAEFGRTVSDGGIHCDR
jgi:hypothetical protein